MLCRVGYLMAQSSGVRPALDLNLTTGTLPSVVTFSRASTATDSFYTDAAGSSFNSYSSGVARLLATGLLMEESRTQRLLNSAAPVTQTTASLATGTYVFWCIGTGSVTSSAGTATASGLGAITGSQGTFQTIVVTVAGTLAFTVSGSIDRFQLELGQFPTTFISSAGATATRAVDAATMAISAFGLLASPTALTMIAKATTMYAAAFLTQNIAQIDDGTTNNRLILRRLATRNTEAATQTAAVAQAAVVTGVVADSSIIRIWGAFATDNYNAGVIGNAAATPDVSGTMSTGLSTLRIGNATTANAWNFTIAKLKIYKTRLPDAQAAAIAAAL